MPTFEVVKVSGRHWGHFGQRKSFMLNCCNLKCFKTKCELLKSVIQALFWPKITIYMALLFVQHSYLLTAEKMNFSTEDFFSKCDQIRSHLLEKSLMKNFIFCAVSLICLSWRQENFFLPFQARRNEKISGGEGWQLWNIVGNHDWPTKKFFHFKSFKTARKTSYL